MPVLVMRQEDLPVAHVPSRAVTCAICLADCWLSLRTGDELVSLAIADGDGRLICLRCIHGVMDEEGDDDVTFAFPTANPAAAAILLPELLDFLRGKGGE